MSTSLIVMAISGLLVATLFFLNKAEAAKGQRLFLPSLRAKLDEMVLARTAGWNRWKKYVGASTIYSTKGWVPPCS